MCRPDSFLSLTKKIGGVKQTHRPTAHNSKPLSTPQPVFHSFFASAGICKEKKGERRSTKITANHDTQQNFLKGMCHFNHWDCPSFASLSSFTLHLHVSPRFVEMMGTSDFRVTGLVRGTKSKNQTWSFTQGFWVLLRRSPLFRSGAKSLQVNGSHDFLLA